MGQSTRLAIIRVLAEDGQPCVRVIVDRLSMGQSAISHHVAKLKQAGLLDSRRQGKWIYYSLDVETIKSGRFAFLAEVVGQLRMP